MRRLASITVLLLALAAAPQVAAKEVESVTACGIGDCTTSRAAGLLRAMTDIGPPTNAPPRPAPFYRLTVEIGDGGKALGRFRSWWVPSAARLHGEDGTWMAVRPAVRRGLARLTRGLATLPAARLPGFPIPDAKAGAPPPAEPVSSPSDVPVVPIVATVMALAVAGLVVRRHLVASKPGRALDARE